ncbi:MAG: DUF4337 domain-containing protein [Hyphomicrobium sp.]
MAIDPVAADDIKPKGRDRDKLIGVCIGILAVALAICGLGGGNAAKDATLKNIEATNTWAFFQAKNARRQTLRLQAEELELLMQTTPTLSEEARTAISAKVTEYRSQEKLLTSDPAKKEGLDELWTKGKALEVERDVALHRDPYFDYGEALLQIAIVLASISIISGSNLLLIGSLLLGAAGCVLTVGGFTLAFPLPF